MIAAIDSSAGQLTADGLLVVLILANAAIGWRTGTLRRILAFAGLYVGVVAAYYTGNAFASAIHKGDIFANAWAFIAVFAVVVLAFEVIGKIMSERLDRLAAVAFDRVAGTVIGAAVGFFQALVIFWVAVSVGAAPSLPNNGIPANRDVAARAVQQAVLSGASLRAEPGLRTIVAPLMNTDLTGHLQEGTRTTA